MAITNIEKQALSLNTWGAITFTTATSATDGVALDFTGDDHKTVVLVKGAGSSATVTIKMGDGYGAVQDMATETIDANTIKAIRLDSFAFKNVAGTEKGKVVAIPSSTGLGFAVVELP